MGRRPKMPSLQGFSPELIPKVFKDHKPGEKFTQEELKPALAEIYKMHPLFLMQMNEPQEKFIRTKNAFGRTPKRRIFEAGVKSGKTRIGIAEDIAHAMGFRPWLKKDDPDFKVNVRVPNQGLIGCETMLESVPGKIEPELRALIPAVCGPEWKNNQMGVLKSVTLTYDYFGNKCGSTINVRSYNQLADTFQGIDFDWQHWDEPPPQDILLAAERGKIATNAPSWFTMTPLKEAYIYNMFSLKAFNLGGGDQEIAAFRAPTWDNCQDYCRKCDITIPQNIPENMTPEMFQRPVNRCPKCGKIMGFIPKKGIEEFFKNLTPDDREAWEEGKWAHLTGLVYRMDRESHIYKDFEIPKSWMRVESVDPHDARRTRWFFAAISPEEIMVNGKPANRVYWYTYLLADGNIPEIVRQVMVKRAEYGYTQPAMVVLDAKYGVRTQRSALDFTSWEEQLEDAGVKNIVLSHSDPGDIALGHKLVKEYLKPHYSNLQGREFPGMMFAEEGCKGERGPIQDMFNYQWQPGTDKPQEDYKDGADCVRYLALEQPIYREPPKEIDPRVIQHLLREKLEDKSKYDPLTWGLRTF